MLERDSLLPEGGRPKHLLWALHFMKVYPKQSPGCLAVGASTGAVDPKTHRKWVWAFIDAVANLVDTVVSFRCSEHPQSHHERACAIVRVHDCAGARTTVPSTLRREFSIFSLPRPHTPAAAASFVGRSSSRAGSVPTMFETTAQLPLTEPTSKSHKRESRRRGTPLRPTNTRGSPPFAMSWVSTSSRGTWFGFRGHTLLVSIPTLKFSTRF